MKAALISLFLIITVAAFGQPMISLPNFHLERGYQDEGNKNTANLRLEATGIPLPFSDNFTYNEAVTFSSRWLDNTGILPIFTLFKSGVYSNVARFNGLDERGFAYDTLLTKRIQTDSLISQPINLGGYLTGDSVRLSFTWQLPAKGMPDSASGDNFILFAKGGNNSWQQIWQAPYFPTTNVLYTESFLLDPSFLSDGFQIKFLRNGPSYEDSIVWYLSNVEITKTLRLPFWEDFSDVQSFGSKFKTRTGVYINNTVSVNQPSINVVSFDGLNEAGRPYGSTPYQYGMADSLVSLPINLEGLGVEDSLFLTFFWQNGGFGEEADGFEGDSLVLLAYDGNARWNTIWTAPFAESISKTSFRQVVLKIDKPEFFHKNFRFKFRNYGKVSGSFDIWSVDYIVLDTIRNNNPNVVFKEGDRVYFSDQAISNQPTPLLSLYNAVPSFHFSSFAFKDTFSYSVTTLSRGNNAASTFDTISVVGPNSTTGFRGASVLDFVLPHDSTLKIIHPIPSNTLSPVQESFQLVNTVSLAATVQNQGQYLFEQNDQFSAVYPFEDYYSYDDGSYERSLYNQQKGASHALRYTSFLDDTLTHIDISIPYDGYNVGNNIITLMVWPDDNGKPSTEEIFAKDTLPVYSTGRNPFTRYWIGAIPIAKEVPYYIGFVQTDGGRSAVRIGLDLNNNAKTHYYYFNNDDPNWTQLGNINGAPMMRPVFSTVVKLPEDTSTSTRKEELITPLQVFPNPNETGVLNLSAAFDRVEVFDIAGKLMLTSYSTSKVDITSLKQGIYFMKAYLYGKRQDTKFIYQPN